MPLFQSAGGLAAGVARIVEWARPRAPELVLGVEARGFVLGGAVAVGPRRRASRPRASPASCPARRSSESYDARVRHRRAGAAPRRRRARGRRVLLHDDLLATGGTALAACRLVEALGGRRGGRSPWWPSSPSCRAASALAGLRRAVTGDLRQRGGGAVRGLIGVDIGGSGIKAGVVDARRGRAGRRARARGHPAARLARGGRDGDGRAGRPVSAPTRGRSASACRARSSAAG